MKKNFASLPVAIALCLPLLAGCASLFGKHAAAPAYDMPALQKDAVAVSPESGAGEAYVVGSVRCAPDAAGRALRAFDAATGRSAYVSGWQMAEAPDVLVARQLRRHLVASRPAALVLDGSMAARAPAHVRLDAWIDVFRVEKRTDGWYFVLDATLYLTARDGKMEGRKVASSICLAGAGEAEPKPESIVHAIAQALDAFDRP